MKFLFVLTLAILSFAAVNADSTGAAPAAPAPAQPAPAESLGQLLNEIADKLNNVVNAGTDNVAQIVQDVLKEVQRAANALPNKGVGSVLKTVVDKVDGAGSGVDTGLETNNP